jgi:solute carrier family 31 (copper transporter), member 1
MLVFMTYNVSSLDLSFFLMANHASCKAYLILAVVVGAGVGHYMFAEISTDDDAKGMACH